MASASKVDAIQRSVMATVRSAMADYQRRNLDTHGKATNKPPREFVEKIIRSRLSGEGLIGAFVQDALATLDD